MNTPLKSDAELALDALHHVGALTDEQHEQAVERLRADIARQYTKYTVDEPRALRGI